MSLLHSLSLSLLLKTACSAVVVDITSGLGVAVVCGGEGAVLVVGVVALGVRGLVVVGGVVVVLGVDRCSLTVGAVLSLSVVGAKGLFALAPKCCS